MPRIDHCSAPAPDPLRACSLTEVAERLCVSLKTVRRMVDSGDLKAFRPHKSGRTIRVSEAALRDFFDAAS
ncbi:helix-turn-helix domain-containing protein [Frondihabitans australicus]|uniref:Excisionase family DNA binding protein n=1 Tax=Frondihabitans australicus TaxID=386892 RepID=A0A495II17_9MICO|nr:helix-turn-helix domain-containing protein [Frondihabitans australicus]RKR74755.1 excisionase family DNA binding protein [Frondihabitans australicus]